MKLAPQLQDELTRIVTQNRVVLFMKGSRTMPQCGFSAQVVSILDDLLPRYETVDVLASPELRDGIKAFSDWPTIPQLYVDGKFVGGCDIVREMHSNGELRALVGGGQTKLPTIEVTPAAREAFAAAADAQSSDRLRLEIDRNFTHDLYYGPAEQGDVEVDAAGLALAMDPASAVRADGLRIDFVKRATGSGFAMTNPNAPASVKSMSVAELAARMKDDASGKTYVLIDVRTSTERAIASIGGSKDLDACEASIRAMPKDTMLIFQCHHGMRSRAAAEKFLSIGFTNVWNLEGGIEAWSVKIDPAVKRY